MNEDKDDQFQFYEIPDQIPYKKIEVLELLDVKYNAENTSFDMRLKKKYSDDIPGEHTINRTMNDMSWLLSKLQQEVRNNVIFPTLPTRSYWENFKNITEHFTKNTKLKAAKQQQNYFFCVCVQRFFRIIKEVILQNIGRKSSLFIFIDEKFSLYRLSPYRKEDEKSTALVGFSQKIASSGKMLFDFINPWKSQKKSYLEEQFERVQKLLRKMSQFNVELTKLMSSFRTLSDNFLAQRAEFLNKENMIYTVSLKTETITKILSLIKMQIEYISEKSSSEKVIEAKQIEKQLKEYAKIIQNEVDEIDKSVNLHFKEFSQLLLAKKNINISIKKIYHPYKGND